MQHGTATGARTFFPGKPKKTAPGTKISLLLGAQLKLRSQGDDHDTGNQNDMPRMPGEKSYCRHMRMQHGVARNPDRRKLGGLPVHSRGALHDLSRYRVYRARQVTSVATIARKGMSDNGAYFLVLYEVTGDTGSITGTFPRMLTILHVHVDAILAPTDL